MCVSELIVNVPCQQRTVDTKNHVSAHHPPTSHMPKPSATGGTRNQLSSQRSSGYLRRSFTWCSSVFSNLSERIQPTWLHQKPSICAECTSPVRSLLRWCNR